MAEEEPPGSRIFSGTGEEILSSGIRITPETETGTATYMGRIAQQWHSRIIEASYAAARSQTMRHEVPLPLESLPPDEATPNLLIQATIITLGDRTNEGQLVEAIAIPWFEIIRELGRNPKFLYEIDWRKMEELIAGAYKKEGYSEVILTPRSGDKGKDIIATKPGFGSIRIFDQVKAYGPGRRVPAKDVRELLGVLDREQNVSKGIVTTTSTFAPGVEKEMKALIPHRLELKTGPQLVEWLTGLMPPS